MPHDRVSITVEKGVVTLEGAVEWQYQREAAVRVMARLAGVTGVVNLLHVAPPAAPRNLKAEVEGAFNRSALVNAAGIYIDAVGSKVILRGVADSWHEAQDAERIAWAAPGVAAVENELVVRVPQAKTA